MWARGEKGTHTPPPLRERGEGSAPCVWSLCVCVHSSRTSGPARPAPRLSLRRARVWGCAASLNPAPAAAAAAISAPLLPLLPLLEQGLVDADDV
jgi:hypothetical protein